MPYQTDGYAIVPLFSLDEVARLREVVRSHMGRVTSVLLKPAEETAPDAGFDRRIEDIAATDQSFAQLLGTAVSTDAQRDPAVAGLVDDGRLQAAAEELSGCALGEKIVRFRANSSALTKQRQGWHSDVARTTGECSTLTITGWIPLSDAGPASGGLELIPGRRHEPVHHHDGVGKIGIAEADLADLPSVIPQVPAGHCLLMDRFTPHRAIENTSGLTRWSLVVWMKNR